MIITRTPFRISFAGGGSDLPSFYRRHTGAVLSTAIDKYMYIVLHPFFQKDKMQLKYSKNELVGDVNDIRHPIFREVLKEYGLSGIDINSIADVPSGTGLGSSSSFTVGLLNAVRAYLGKASGAGALGAMACDVEINKVGSPIGKQDQYAAAYGGLNLITFHGDESVVVERIIMDRAKKKELEHNLFMFYLGGKHSANEILKRQQEAISNDDKFEVQKKMVQLAYDLKDRLENNDIDAMGTILHEGWLMKKSLTNGITSDVIDTLYNKGIKAGATGGKLLGAGGAGFMLFYCPGSRHEDFLGNMCGESEMKFNFDDQGSKIIHIGDML